MSLSPCLYGFLAHANSLQIKKTPQGLPEGTKYQKKVNQQNNLFNVEAFSSTNQTYLADWKHDTNNGLRGFKKREITPDTLHHAAKNWTQQEIGEAIALLQSLLPNDSGAAPHTLAPESGWVELYRAGGNARGDSLYYRYSWREGKRTKHKHIPGGSQYAAIAYSRAGILRRLIAAGAGVEKCLEIIEKWKSGG